MVTIKASGVAFCLASRTIVTIILAVRARIARNASLAAGQAWIAIVAVEAIIALATSTVSKWAVIALTSFALGWTGLKMDKNR